MKHLDENEIVEYAQGTLPVDARETAESHFAECPDCRMLLSELARASWIEPPPRTPVLTDPAASIPTSSPPNREATAMTRGETVGRYFVLHRLGAGGMGVVYAAYDPELERKVALKILRPYVSATGDTEHLRQLLMREAQAMARLSHQNVIQVYDVGLYAGQVFVAMEFVDGGTVREWLLEQPRSLGAILEIFAKAGQGLAASHQAGLVHRDFKLDNVLIGKDGRVEKVTDFGLARQAPEGVVDPPSSATIPAASLEATSVVGTPAYMAPEQLEGKPVDARSDQFSFCVALFEALYGARPYQGESAEEILKQIHSGEVADPKQRAIPRHLRLALLRGLALKPKARFDGMPSLLAALRRDPRATWRKRALTAATAVTLAVSIGGFLYVTYQQRQVCQGGKQKLAGAWNDVTRQQLRTAVLATGLPYAADSWAIIETRLDRYAERWATTYFDVCMATQRRGEQSGALLDTRMACLNDNAGALREAIAVLKEATPDRVDKADQFLPSLGEVSACRTTLVPVRGSAPRAPAVAARISGDLARAKVLALAGDHAASLKIADAIVAELRGTPIDTLSVGAMTRRAQALSFLDKPQESRATAIDALTAAESIGDERGAITALVSLIYADGYLLSQFDAARTWAGIAFAKVSHHPERQQLEPQVLMRLSAVAFMQRRFDEVFELNEKALVLLRSATDVDEDLVAKALSRSAGALNRLGRHGEAQIRARESLAIFERAQGPRHPNISPILSTVAEALRSLERFEEALQFNKRALTLDIAIHGANSYEAAIMEANIGAVYGDMKDFAKALEHYRRALPGLKEKNGENDRRYATALGNIAFAEAETGAHASALQHYQQALAIMEKVGSGHVAFILSGIGACQLASAQPARALPPLERAVRILSEEKGDGTELAESRFLLARALMSSRRDQARARRLALEARVHYKPADKRELAAIDEWLLRHGAVQVKGPTGNRN